MSPAPPPLFSPYLPPPLHIYKILLFKIPISLFFLFWIRSLLNNLHIPPPLLSFPLIPLYFSFIYPLKGGIPFPFWSVQFNISPFFKTPSLYKDILTFAFPPFSIPLRPSPFSSISFLSPFLVFYSSIPSVGQNFLRNYHIMYYILTHSFLTAVWKY